MNDGDSEIQKGTDSEWAKAMMLESISNLAEEETYWTFVASRIHLHEVYIDKKMQRGAKSLHGFCGHVDRLVHQGLYTPVLTEKYSQEDLRYLEISLIQSGTSYLHISD